MDKNLVKQFNEEVLKSYVKEDFVLLIDSWNGWYKSGYTEELPNNFDNIIDFCFKNVFANCCAFCLEPAITKCSHCDLYLCTVRFIILSVLNA
jgi:hypothetical protein